MAARWTRKIVIGCALGVALLSPVGTMRAQSVTAVPQLDLAKFTGVWYEIARLPWKKEKDCISDPFILIAEGQKLGKFQVVNSCKTKASVAQIVNGNGKRADKNGDGKLKINYAFLFFIYQKYWVLAEAPDGSWAVVGSPNHKTLFLLSRTPTQPQNVIGEMKARAEAQGFALDKLIFTPRSGR